MMIIGASVVGGDALANAKCWRGLSAVCLQTRAATVLEDESALIREDADSIGEQRFVTLGLSGYGNLLVVVYAYREPDSVRIISAWKANKRQRLQHEKGRR